jgi:hypothetical protein
MLCIRKDPVRQPHTQCVWGVREEGAVSLGYSSSAVKQTTHLHIMLRLRMSGAVSPFPHMSSCCAVGQLYFHPHAGSIPDPEVCCLA